MWVRHAAPITVSIAASMVVWLLGVVALGACGPDAAPVAEAPVPAPLVVAPAPSAEDRSLIDVLDRTVGALLAAEPRAGVVVGVVHRGRARTYGFGSLDPSGGRMPDGASSFEIGAITEVFTGLLLADLAANGHVALDDAVADYVSLPEQKMRYRGQAIRLVDLATHVSGLPPWPSNYREQRRPGARTPRYGVPHLHQFLRSFVPAEAPKARYRHSPLGVGLLGHALAHRMGKDYETLLFERVLLPLGMSGTRMVPAEGKESTVAHGLDVGGRPAEVRRYVPTLAACCGLRSTGDDLLRLVAAYLRADSRLGPALAQSLETHAVADDGAEVGLGWRLEPQSSVVTAAGQTAGFRSFVGFDRERLAGVVVLGGSARWDVASLGRNLLRWMSEREDPLARAATHQESALPPEPSAM